MAHDITPSRAPDLPAPRITRIIILLYILFNLVIAYTLIVDPAQLDATYRGGPMTPTREFLWFSIASFHLFMAAVSAASLRLHRAAEARLVSRVALVLPGAPHPERA